MENNLSYPTVYKNAKDKYYIHFILNGKRCRLSNGKKINSVLYPNTFPKNQRRKKAAELANLTYNYLIDNNYQFEQNRLPSEVELFDEIIANKLSEPLSRSYKYTLNSIAEVLRTELVKEGKLGIKFIEDYMKSYSNPTSFNTVRRHLNAVLNCLKENGFDAKISRLRPLKQSEILHKPIPNIPELLDEVKAFNHNLYLCCLFTYCCLLRPHREIRLLKWKDFSEDLKYVSIDGSRVKSKRNRIVPVPEIIRENLEVSELENYIFTNDPIEFNRDYFKTLWSRFKRSNKAFDKNITLYSFRHSGAIDLFKRTGSISKLQSAMGHSSIKVSLTYLRGLEVPELTEDDMPVIEL